MPTNHEPPPPSPLHEDAPVAAAPLTGAALAKAALASAREAAAAKQLEHERGAAARRRAATRTANGPARRPLRADADDPVPFGAAIADLLADRGWTADAAVASVTANWAGTVGAAIADHCQPVSLRDGVLTIEAESTAWATQIRLLSGSLLRRIAEVSGDGTVTRLSVHGPTGPSWKHGRLSAGGQGPRDTYG